MGVLRYPVPPVWDGRRTQDFLRQGCGLSWRMVVRLRNLPGGITVDGATRRAIDPVRAGETVLLTLPDDNVRIEAVELPLTVVYEDEHLLVADKPPFLAVHPSAGKPEPTLANAVVAHWEKQGTPCSFRPVNRLDRNTSGLLLAAKNAHVTYALTRKPEKEYLAVVHGAVTEAGVIDRPIRIREGSIIAREVGEGGKESLTRYWPLATDGTITLLRVVIETGRTHQIRVHMSSVGHPLVGDTLYGDEAGDGILDRHALHCARMRFDHPITGVPLSLSAPLPADMRAVLENRQIPIPEEYI